MALLGQPTSARVELQPRDWLDMNKAATHMKHSGVKTGEKLLSTIVVYTPVLRLCQTCGRGRPAPPSSPMRKSARIQVPRLPPASLLTDIWRDV